MSSASGLTGRWVGEYEQMGRSSPIEADLEVDADGRLTGVMRDGRTEEDLSVFEATASAGLPPGADEQIEAALRQLLPDRTGEAIRYVAHLPTESELEGRVEGPSVTFLKSYRGEHYAGYKLGDAIVGVHTEHHSVRYRGRLSADGQTLEGHWSIEDPTGHRSEGPFVLRRARP